MNLEKRNAGAPQQPTPETDKPARGKKPVIVYIMILFIVAFLLMALSFFSHQRSNDQAMVQLQSSVTAMQNVQAAQEKIIDLQDELAILQTQLRELEEKNEAAEQALTDAEAMQEALLSLYRLQQNYTNGDYAACKTILDEMEQKDKVALLPAESSQGVTAPQLRFQQLKEAVLAKLAENEA